MLSFHGLDVVLFLVFVLLGLFVFGLLLSVLGVFGFCFLLVPHWNDIIRLAPRIHEACYSIGFTCSNEHSE